MHTKKTAVLLLNLGGPEKQEDVEPFLYNLFSDRQIIRLGPWFLQKFIARRIARKRAPSSRENYRKIGGGSPILAITKQQASALEEALKDSGDYLVRICMRYWHPFADEVLPELARDGVGRIIALPLYPQYSVATTGSSLTDLHRTADRLDLAFPIQEIRSWPDQPQYINCLAGRVREGLGRFKSTPEVVYSAHSLPQKFIDEGDPYVDDLHKTIFALEKITGIQGHLCYQSRSGPVEWLEPSTPDMLRRLASSGCRNILMVPISFVSDHVETLYEIDMLYREMAAELGMELRSTSALNDDPEFIEALRNLVLSQPTAPTAM
ncbi:ferrochelatase [Desulfolithobacter sp.]